jgi:hypothetical protein
MTVGYIIRACKRDLVLYERGIMREVGGKVKLFAFGNTDNRDEAKRDMIKQRIVCLRSRRTSVYK